MIRFALRRLGTLLPLLVVVSAVTFALLELAPGDPALRIVTAQTSGPPDLSQVEEVRAELGLDDPLVVRYVRWLGGVVRGDFGRSAIDGDPIAEVVVGAVVPTLLLTGTGLVISVIGAVVLGTFVGASGPGRFATATRRAIGALTTVTVVVPTFLIALGAVWLFAVRLDWFPAGGMSDPGEPRTIGQVIRHLALPALVLGVGTNLAMLTKVLGGSIHEHRDAEFVRCARSRGVGTTAIARSHLLRTSLLPVVAQIGASMSFLVGGAYAVEVVFGWPGLGRIAVQAAQDQDTTLILAITFVSGVVVVAGNLAADLLLAVLDPRVRLHRPAPPRRRADSDER